MSNTNKTIQQLNLEDDFLFAKVMSDKEVCSKVLEKILSVSLREVSMPATQKTINMLYDGKGIRLDVYLTMMRERYIMWKWSAESIKKPFFPRDRGTIREALILTSSLQAKITGN